MPFLALLHAPAATAQAEYHVSQRLGGPGYVSVWADREEPYRRGEEARIYLRTSRAAYLTVLRVDTDGRVRILFPREPWSGTRVAGERTFEVTRPPDGRSFQVDDYPGIGYLFAIASSSPFDYDDITRGDHWDYRAIHDGRVKGDPYVVLADFAASIARAGDYRYDIAPYYVERRYEYPRFVCYDCHSSASYEDWDPYAASCTRFRIVIYDDPSYYPYRYNQGRNVVVDRPAHPDPMYVFKDARPATEYVTQLRGSARPGPPAFSELRRRDAEREPDHRREEARGRRDEAPEGLRPAHREPRRVPVERRPPNPRSTGEPELRRRKPDPK